MLWSLHRANFPPNSCTPYSANININTTSRTDTYKWHKNSYFICSILIEWFIMWNWNLWNKITNKISLNPRHNSYTTRRICGTSINILRGRIHRNIISTCAPELGGISLGIQQRKTRLTYKSLEKNPETSSLSFSNFITENAKEIVKPYSINENI